MSAQQEYKELYAKYKAAIGQLATVTAERDNLDNKLTTAILLCESRKTELEEALEERDRANELHELDKQIIIEKNEEIMRLKNLRKESPHD